MDNDITIVSIPLLPFIELRKEQEAKRAARARKRKKVRRIPVRFPSVNDLYPFSKRTGRKYLSPEGGLYKDYVDERLTQLMDIVPCWDRYEVSYVFFMTHEMMYTKEGELADTDVSNYLKATEDALFEWLLESDKLVMSVHGHKRLTVNEPKLVILISPSSESAIVYHREHALDPYELEIGSESVQTSL